MSHRGLLIALAVVGASAACSGPDNPPETASGIGNTLQCPDSVVRAVDGGDPIADALPNVVDSITSRSAAEEALQQDRGVLIDRYDARRVQLAEGFGRAWTGENGGSYSVVDIEDFGVVVTLNSMGDCPTGGDLHVTSSGGLPLFFFASA